MTTKQKSTFGPNEFDIRVRERFLANGTTDATRLAKHLGELKDVESKCEDVGLAQPALTGEESDAEDV